MGTSLDVRSLTLRLLVATIGDGFCFHGYACIRSWWLELRVIELGQGQSRSTYCLFSRTTNPQRTGGLGVGG
jgi:hypothetical protein